MGKRKSLSADNPCKDGEESWKKIFKGIAEMIQDQQRQLESLVTEHKLLVKRIRLQHDRWVSDVRLFEDQISQLKSDSKIKEMARLVEAAKVNFIIEDINDEQADFKVLFDEISQCLVKKKRNKDDDVSALIAERDFAWKQYKNLDNKLQEQVKKTKSEVQDANDKIQKIVFDFELSESSKLEKSQTILDLKDEMAMIESNSRKKGEEISRLSEELYLMRNSVKPVLRSRLNGMAVPTKKDLPHLRTVEKGCGSLKRKADSTAENPRLFSSPNKDQF